jgi:hypothetical protein
MPLPKDAKVELVGRLDEASAAAPASGHRDEDMGRRHRFIQHDDRNISLPCATWIVDVKPGTSGIWKRFTGWHWLPATCQIRVTLSFSMNVTLHWVDAGRPLQ